MLLRDHNQAMSRFLGVLIHAVLGLTLVGCERQESRRALDACEAIKQSPQLLGTSVAINAWFSNRYHWAAIGSGDCPDMIIEIILAKPPSLIVTFDGPSSKAADEVRRSLAEGLYPSWDFRGRFSGVLERRTGPTPFAPPVDKMPLVLRVTRIDGISVERASWSEPPPPEPERNQVTNGLEER
jgi:hypothetical protein